MTRNSWTLSPTHADLRRPPASATPLTLDAEPSALTLDLGRTALLVVDMQNDFVAEGGWLNHIGVDVSGAAEAITTLDAGLPVLRDAGVPVIWLNWGNRPDLANLPPGVRHVYDPDGSGGGIGDRAGRSEAVLTQGSWGAAITESLHPDPRDLFVDKYRMSGFFDTPLDSVLRNLRVDTLLFAGVNADQCVYATLTDAACLGYDVIMLSDVVATTSPSYCMEATTYNVRQCYGFTALFSALIARIEKS
ncbi:cysteine hydrolase [Gordonia sp. zg691]|uniref:Cysteine hydrolase n=1 Tax=Gordonia jinghuaiqii TaxID=2758710 RepID=A0A7D7LTZ0_9ACTN|nr:cysteine hydrolase [Gordonia jinghuaiqii]MBD0860679.1 cysteine hydrolase [Gordonia jinghuaiqii]MCR5978055.1 isochorismatase family protein [Gordonia jinghuaiqii]QMT01481.1 cysteine hydrolase [Gordonia jinghuaiqii]